MEIGSSLHFDNVLCLSDLPGLWRRKASGEESDEICCPTVICLLAMFTQSPAWALILNPYEIEVSIATRSVCEGGNFHLNFASDFEVFMASPGSPRGGQCTSK